MVARITQAEFENRVKKKYGNEYTVLGKYISSHIPIKLKHNTCGNIWESTRPGDFLKSRPNTCPKCSHRSFSFSIEEYREKVSNDTKNEYLVLSRCYKNNKTKMLYKHLVCGHEWMTRPDLFNQGHRCPKCAVKLSKAFEEVIEYLDFVGITYETEVTFEGLKLRQQLYIDIYIEEYALAIECDGEQHYKPTKGREDNYYFQMKRDKAKANFCKEHGIDLIRIPTFFNKGYVTLYLQKLLYEHDVITL